MNDATVPENIEEFQGSTDTERWIRQFIEYDLMDPAWFEILRRHPEIQVDSDGKKVVLPRNHNLKKSCRISSSTDYEKMVGTVLSDSSNTITVSIDDKVIVRSKESGAILGELQLRDEATKLPVPTGLPTSQLFPGTFYHLKAFHHANIVTKRNDGRDLEEEPVKLLQHRNRLVLLTCDLFVESLGADPAPKKGKDKNAVVDSKPKTFMRHRLTVLDIYSDDESAKIDNIFDWYVGGETHPELDNFDSEKALNEAMACSLGADGRVLSVLSREAASSMISLYDLPPPKAPVGAEEFTASTNTSPGTAPVLIAQCKIDNMVRDISIVALPYKETEGGTVEEKNLYFYEHGLLVLVNVNQASFLPLLRLLRKPVDAPPANAKAAKAPPKGAPEVVPPPAVLCIFKEVLRLRLTSPASVFTTAVLKADDKDPKTGDAAAAGLSTVTPKSLVLVAVGHMDGAVTLWNLLENVCVSTLGKHQTLPKIARAIDGTLQKTLTSSIITAIKMIPAALYPMSDETNVPPSSSSTPASGNVILIVAGAIDGSMSFYSTAGATFDDLRVSSPQFSDFRHDLYEDAVVDFSILRATASPAGVCFVAHHASGSCAVYKVYRGRHVLLVGSLSLEERVDFREIKSAFLSVSNLPREPFIPPPDVLNPPPPPEPVAAAKAGKGKDVPVAEPEPEPTSEELALKAAEEARQRAEDYRTMMLNVRTAHHSMQQCMDIVHRGHLIKDWVGIGSVSHDGRYVVSLSRDGKAAIATFSLVSFIAQAMESDEVIRDFLQSINQPAMNDSLVQESSIIMPEPSRASAKGVSRVRSSLPLTSANTHSLATLNAGSITSYKQVRLTEQRLHAHEQQLEETRRGFFDWNAGSQLDDMTQEEDESLVIPHGPPPADPVLAAKGEMLRSKRDRMKAKPGAFSKKLTTLASLCL